MSVTKKSRLLKTNEVAKIADVSPRTVARWLRDGELKGVKLNGHSWRVDSRILKRFLQGKIEAPE
jgi:excisionase family DNA binding protein